VVNGSACYKAPVDAGRELPEWIDVAIVGGGFAGCATAWALAQRGVQAIVLEREPELGRQASGRGAGLGRQLAEDDATSRLTSQGAAMLRERFPKVWSRTGGVLSFDDAHRAQAYIARAQRLAIAHEVIDHRRLLARWPALTGLTIASAIHVPDDGVIDARALLSAFAEAITLAHDVSVVRISDHRGGVRLETTRGTLEARVVVDAAGAWAGLLTDDPPLESYKRHLFVLEAAPQPNAPYLWHLGTSELYVRDEAGATLVSACDSEPTPPIDQQPSPGAEALLRARLSPLAPAWADVPIARRWACQRAFTPDRQMRLGRDPRRPWLVWAAGLGGHGATASPAVGGVVADAVLEALATRY